MKDRTHLLALRLDQTQRTALLTLLAARTSQLTDRLEALERVARRAMVGAFRANAREDYCHANALMMTARDLLETLDQLEGRDPAAREFGDLNKCDPAP